MKVSFLLIFLVIIGLFGPAQAIEFKAGGGANYTIEYPDGWYRVPYGTVSQFLRSQEIDEAAFTYSAVLASRDNQRFNDGPYMFIFFDSVGAIDQAHLDTSLMAIRLEYGKSPIYGSIDSIDGKLEQDQPVYDSAFGAVVTKSTVTYAGNERTMLEMIKYYQEGIAAFLCYTPQNMYDANEKIYLDILRSFVYQADASASGDNVTIDEPGQNSAGGSGLMVSFLLIIIGLIVVILILVYLKKRFGSN